MAGGEIGADGIAIVRSLQGLEGQGQVLNRAGKWPHMVEAAGEQIGPGAGKPAIGGLETIAAAEGGGDADGAVGVGAETEGDEARCHRRSGAAGGAAGDAAGILGIWSGAVVFVDGDEAVGIFIHVEGTDADGSGGFEPGNGGGVLACGWVVAVDLGPGQGGGSFNVEEVFDGEGDACEGAEGGSGVELAIYVSGGGLGAVGQDGGEAVEPGIALVDVGQGCLNNCLGGGAAVADGGGDFGGGGWLGNGAHGSQAGGQRRRFE